MQNTQSAVLEMTILSKGVETPITTEMIKTALHKLAQGNACR